MLSTGLEPLFAFPNILPPRLAPPEGWHVLVVHFPIALLAIVPLFVFLAMAMPTACRWASYAAVVLLLLGTLGLYAAISTGENARDAGEAIADGSADLQALVREHEEFGEWTRNVYTAVTIFYSVFVILPVMLKKLATSAFVFTSQFIFLLVLCVASLFLVNTAHLGGFLVHEWGVRATLSTDSQ
jgi:hypothetical protein